MKRRTRIKFCGFVRAQDIRVAAALGADAMGLVFYEKSPRLLDLESARELRRVMPSWVACVGLFVNSPPEQVKGYSNELGLDVVQLHGDEAPAQCLQSVLAGQRYWRAVRMRETADLLNSWSVHPQAESFVLDAFSDGYGGSGQRFDWTAVPAAHGRSLIISGGLDSESVGDAITRLHPDGVDVSSGIQGSDPRKKDAEKMESFISAVMAADASL
ncbi:MAG: phosphoribosylanthranilate isomerase [Burkholderiaceae bacterium]